MILSETVIIKTHNKTYKYWINKGYIFDKIGDSIEVIVSDLLPNSKIKIRTECDNCFDIKQLSYSSYFKSVLNQNKYYCCKCSYIKSGQTLFDNYGYRNPSHIEEFKSKRTETYIKNWNVTNPNKSKSVRDKISHTCDVKYNRLYYFQTDVFKSNCLEKNRLNILEYNEIIKNKYQEILGYVSEYTINTYFEKVFNITHHKCGKNFDIKYNNIYDRLKDNIEICLNCLSLNSTNIYSSQETELYHYISSIYNGIIIRNDRTVLNGKELDIYLPEIRLGIEYNGLYWHSHLFVSDTYHRDKYKMCYESNISLIGIYEDEWLDRDKKENICSIISEYINNITDHIFYRIEPISDSISNDFRNKYDLSIHEYEYDQSEYKFDLGLYISGTLVSCICCIIKDKDITIVSISNIPFCDINRYTILLHFIQYLSDLDIGKYIEIDIDIRLYDSNILERNGFIKIGESNRFFYIKNKKRFSSLSSMKIENYNKLFDYGTFRYRFR